MFSYRHGFHAGNHADVLKHVVLVQLLKHLAAKEKPFMAVDTHAGAGAYSLDPGTYAAKSGEYLTGINKLFDRIPDAPNQRPLPHALADYLAQIAAFNPEPTLRRYPGSPQLIAQMTREQDPLRFFEWHPTESGVLAEYFHSAGRRVSVRAGDGFALLKSVLPPPSRRAVVLMDPSYEDKADYISVVSTMTDALQRFPTGVYAIWYPQVRRRESRRLPEELQQIAGTSWLHVSLTISAPAGDGIGLFGSGMFVFNPPWQLLASLREAMPILKALLGQDRKADFSLKGRQP